MRPRVVHRTSGVVLSVLASVGLVLALSACTVSTVPPTATATATATATPDTATLTCAYTFVLMPPLLEQPPTGPFVGDELELLCLVTGAPSPDTSFTLTLVITGHYRPPITPPSSPCTGTLQQGRGACAHTYLLWVGPPPVTPTDQPFTSFVYGHLLPSHRPLGPVIPILATSQ